VILSLDEFLFVEIFLSQMMSSLSSNVLSRLTKLEAENVELQEEILFLKKQLTNVSLSPQHHRNGPRRSDSAEVELLEQTVADLRLQVERAVAELRKYRHSLE